MPVPAARHDLDGDGGGCGGNGGGSSGIGRGRVGGDGKAVGGSVDFAAGYVHLTRAGRDEDTVEVMEWTGGSNSFPQDAEWVRIQPMRVNGVTVTPASTKIKPGGTVNFTAKISVLNLPGVNPLNVTKGVEWTVTGRKGYTITDGILTVKADETVESLTVTAKYGTHTGSAAVTVEQTVSPEEAAGIVKIGNTRIMPLGGTVTSNQDGTMTVPGGSIITPPGGPNITVNSRAAVDENGNVTLSRGGSATVSGTTVTVPDRGGTITPNGDGTVNIPSGSKITSKDGKRTTVPSQGGTLSQDGAYEDNVKPVFHDGPVIYPPAISTPVNGKVSVSPLSPRKGDTVTVTLTPNGDYEIGSVAVRNAGGGRLDLRDNHDGTYSFTQPGETVTVEAAFIPRSSAMPFFDVWPDDWCYDAVHYVNSRDIMGGYGNGFFRPDAPITREQFAVMLYRFQQSRGGGSAGNPASRLSYADAESIGGYAREAAAWCTMNNIMGDYGDNTLRPKGQTTRAQAAVMLMRFCERG